MHRVDTFSLHFDNTVISTVLGVMYVLDLRNIETFNLPRS